MKSIKLTIALSLLILYSVPALEYGNSFYSQGWWFGMSDDSFGFGIPSEADDLHTVGLQGGYKGAVLFGSLFYDVYTYRGTGPAEHTRTDRLRLRLGREGRLGPGPLNLAWQLAATLGLDGNAGGYWVQHYFHYAFLNHRPIPEISDYDTSRFFIGLAPRLEAAFTRGGLSGGGELEAVITYPWLVTLDPTLFCQYRGGDSRLRFSAAWTFTPAAGSYRTYALARRYAAGLWLNGYLATGPLFYHFSYNPLQQLTDGRIGYQWSRRQPSSSPPLWAMMEAGIEILKLGPELYYEDNTLWELFFDSGFPGGYFYLLLKNGGQYVDDEYAYNAKNFVCGTGYEQHFPSPLRAKQILDPFLGMNLFVEQLREHTFTAYRSTTRAEMGLLGSSLQWGVGFWLPPSSAGGARTGLRLSAFLSLPHFTFGSGAGSPGLAPAQRLRWGFRAGLTARP